MQNNNKRRLSCASGNNSTSNPDIKRERLPPIGDVGIDVDMDDLKAPMLKPPAGYNNNGSDGVVNGLSHDSDCQEQKSNNAFDSSAGVMDSVGKTLLQSS